MILLFVTKDNGESVLTSSYQPNNAEKDLDGMKLAIKLHNKVKNLASNSYLELRNVLKANSGLMLIFYGLKSLKVISPAVKILSSAGKDLQRCSNADAISLQCLSSAVQIWASTNSIMIEQLLSPLEFQDMKILVCQV